MEFLRVHKFRAPNPPMPNHTDGYHMMSMTPKRPKVLKCPLCQAAKNHY